MTAECMACSVGKTVAEFCKHHPQFDGCHGIYCFSNILHNKEYHKGYLTFNATISFPNPLVIKRVKDVRLQTQIAVMPHIFNFFILALSAGIEHTRRGAKIY